ncbi:MAG: transcriptional regulator [Flavobacteriales bacterium]|nr:transcriptional regulator [Flavobacteriales bacterium]
MEVQEAKEKFINAWRGFGTSWGINKTMAQIHACLMVSEDPLSTDDLMESLDISRGNVNMNIRSLIEWGVVHKTFIKGDRKEYFEAEKDIWKLARIIARERKRRELDPIVSLIGELNEDLKQDDSEASRNFQKLLSDVSDFAQKSGSVLDRFSKSDHSWFAKVLMKLIK